MQLACNIDKALKLYRGDNVAYNFIRDITKEEKYCSDIISKHFNNKLLSGKD